MAISRLDYLLGRAQPAQEDQGVVRSADYSLERELQGLKKALERPRVSAGGQPLVPSTNEFLHAALAVACIQLKVLPREHLELSNEELEAASLQLLIETGARPAPVAIKLSLLTTEEAENLRAVLPQIGEQLGVIITEAPKGWGFGGKSKMLERAAEALSNIAGILREYHGTPGVDETEAARWVARGMLSSRGDK